MEKSKPRLIFALWLLSVSWGYAQTNRYMVFFSDKDHTAFSVDNPEAFLSTRAIARREKIDFPVTEKDLPVDQNYIQSVRDTGADVFFTSKWFNAALVQMDQSLLEPIGQLTFVDSIKYIAPGGILNKVHEDVFIPETFQEPNPVTANTEFQLELIGADQMHKDGYRGEGMLIGVFDNGFSGVNRFQPFEHLFDENRIIGWKDFVRNSGNVFQYGDHGSGTLSCIASDYKNVVGTAPGAAFLLCVTEASKEFRVEEYNWLLAAEYADSAGVDIISSSLGYSTFDDPEMDYVYEDLDGNTTVVSRAAKLAAERGILVVVSAGNEGSSSWRYVTAPADVAGILAVGSVNAALEKSSFSSIGSTADGRIKPEVVTLGQSVTIFSSNGLSSDIGTGNGTSFAAPQIAGLAAGIWQANPDWSGERVMIAIKYSGTNATNPDNVIGFGVPAYEIAVQGPELSVTDILQDKITVYPNPFEEELIQIDFGGMRLKSDLNISVIDMEGARIYSNLIFRRDLPDHLEINLSGSQKGVYFLVLESKKFKKTVKLIKI